jgi:Ankyrin repeats (3 copies)
MRPTRRFTLCVLLLCLALGASPALARASRDALSRPQGRLSQDLFLAIQHRMNAAVYGHAGFVKLLLEKGANPNAREEKGRTPLILAALYGDNPAVIRTLVEGGADIRATDARHRTALALATERGHGETAALLRERGADPGMAFLLRTQEEDGSWFVPKRVEPRNLYFDAAFPHGEAQHASFNATCWAVMALLQTIESPHPGAQQAGR